MGLKIFPKGRNIKGAISYMERKSVPEGWGIMTEGVRKIFV